MRSYPSEESLTRLEAIAFTKVTNRISDIRKVCRPLGWDIVNRIAHLDGEIRSYYWIVVWEGIDETD